MPQHLHHPDMHMAASAWSEGETLHVAACYSNPFRWRTRRHLANDFRRHMMKLPNVKLHVIELAYGDRPFEITDPAIFPDDIQVRTKSELFHKENLLNLCIQRFPADWKYGAYCDMDFHFTRHDLGLETIHQLQMYDWVQMFSSYMDVSGHDLGKGHRPINLNYGFAYNYTQNGFQIPAGFEDGGWKKAGDYYGGGKGKHNPVGATGGAWAFRRSAFETCGGLLDRCILGHGDWFMSFGLICEDARDMRLTGYHSAYRNYINSWQRRAALLKKNIGYVDAFAVHHFHGPKRRRAYSSRDEILVKHQYDPIHDISPDYQGVWQLTTEKPGLRDAIRAYFLSRSEDYPHVDEA